jgi:hypothetical protein
MPLVERYGAAFATSASVLAVVSSSNFLADSVSFIPCTPLYLFDETNHVALESAGEARDPSGPV